MYALIIAGGEGQRLRPLTNDRPKAMLSVAGRPLLEHQVSWLRDNGVTNVVIACGYLHEVIQAHFQDGHRWDLEIRYSVEREPLGRGGALRMAYVQVPADEPFVIATNGDNIQTQPLSPVIKQHLRTDAAATLLLTQLRSPYGIAKERGKRIVGFTEKPLLAHWLNAGMYVLSREFCLALPDRGDHEDHLFPRLAGEGRLYGFRSRSYWKAIDTAKDLTEAEQELSHTAAN